MDHRIFAMEEIEDKNKEKRLKEVRERNMEKGCTLIWGGCCCVATLLLLLLLEDEKGVGLFVGGGGLP